MELEALLQEKHARARERERERETEREREREKEREREREREQERAREREASEQIIEAKNAEVAHLRSALEAAAVETQTHAEHIQVCSDLLKEFNTYKEKQVLVLLQAEHDHDQKLSLLKQELEANQSKTKRALDEARAADHKVQQEQDQIQLQTKLISDLNDQIKVRFLFDLRIHASFLPHASLGMFTNAHLFLFLLCFFSTSN
jgi:hypothetical protein